MSEHTKGPWKTDAEFGHEVVLGRDGAMVADCAILHKKRLGEINKTNARLIAAAPDLLAALKSVVAIADRKTVEFDDARAAIAKATQPT
jgi:hypothetical protein